MDDYLEEIRDKGLETLEKFLLLLKEDMILFHSREKQKTQLTDVEFGLLYTEDEGSVGNYVYQTEDQGYILTGNYAIDPSNASSNLL